MFDQQTLPYLADPRQTENKKTWLLLQSLMAAIKIFWGGSNRSPCVASFSLRSAKRMNTLFLDQKIVICQAFHKPLAAVPSNLQVRDIGWA